MEQSSKMEAPLSGLRVLDLSQHVAGPFCARLMGLLGAEVIKVEKPGEGDLTRREGPFAGEVPHPEKSGLFLGLNTNKKSITLNLKTPAGARIFKKLLAETDMVVESFEPGTLPSWGLGYEVMEKISPSLVLTSITNFGQTGPYRHYKASEMTLWAMGGQMQIHGEDDLPLHIGRHVVAYTGGYVAYIGALAALNYAQLTGQGQQVDVSLQECLLWCHAQLLVEYAYTRKETPLYSRGRSVQSPVITAGDGRLLFLVLVAHKWPQFTQLLGVPELAKDPRFLLEEERVKHVEEFEETVLPFMLQHTSDELAKMAEEKGVPLAVLKNTDEVLSNPQYKHREFFQEVEHPLAGKLIYTTPPYKMGDYKPVVSSAPLLGEHNEEIYCRRLGIDRKDLANYYHDGVI